MVDIKESLAAMDVLHVNTIIIYVYPYSTSGTEFLNVGFNPTYWQNEDSVRNVNNFNFSKQFPFASEYIAHIRRWIRETY